LWIALWIAFTVLLVPLGFWLLYVLTGPPGMDVPATKAQLGCKALADVVENYTRHPANTNSEPPRTLDDLLAPPFGGAPLLRNGPNDLLDPWGKPYQMETRPQSDGTVIVLVWTRKPAGTPISQYGIGKASGVADQ
jgi:hypothetical protein